MTPAAASPANPRRRHPGRLVGLGALALAAAAALWFAVDGGRYLERENSLAHADAIFVLGGTRAERWREAYDLYRAGWAPRILLSPDRREPAEVDLRRRGIHFPSDSELARNAMLEMGAPPSAILAPDGNVDNTAAEGEWLRAMARQYGWRRVIIVTSKYHCRRAGFAFRRAMAGTGVDILIRASRYDPSDPAHWLRNRADVRFALSEWEKLVFYRLGLKG